MGRPRQRLDKKQEAEAVARRLKDKTLQGRQRQRLTAVQLGLEGDLTAADRPLRVAGQPEKRRYWLCFWDGDPTNVWSDAVGKVIASPPLPMWWNTMMTQPPPAACVSVT